MMFLKLERNSGKMGVSVGVPWNGNANVSIL